MYAIISFIPIVVTIVLMVGFNWPAKRALPLAWVLAVIIGVAVWKMPFFQHRRYQCSRTDTDRLLECI